MHSQPPRRTSTKAWHWALLGAVLLVLALGRPSEAFDTPPDPETPEQVDARQTPNAASAPDADEDDAD